MVELMRNWPICNLALIFSLQIFFIFSSSLVVAEKIQIAIGGKGLFGPIFPTAGTIANVVNREGKTHGFRLTVQSRYGSVSIIESVLAGTFEFGVVQNRFISQAYKGSADWSGRAQKELRSICSVYPEQIVLVASVESGIQNIRDLNGRRVFIGGSESDLLYTVTDILTAAGINPQSDLFVTGVAVEEAPAMLQDDAVDAFFYILGTMNRAFIDLFSGSSQVVLVPITGMGIDKLTAANPFYVKSHISIESFPNLKNETDIETVSVKASLITSAKVSGSLVYTIAKEVIKNVEIFNNQHPPTKVLPKLEITEGLVAPVHSGANKYYQQIGLVVHGVLVP